MTDEIEKLKERLRKLSEYHIEEFAQRLIEVGGPGVGGTELDVNIPFYEVLYEWKDFTSMLNKSFKKRNITPSKAKILKLEDIEKLILEDYNINVKEEVEKWKINALEHSIRKLWGEANWSYVYGHFRGSIVLSAILVERALKLKLQIKEYNAEGKTLGQCKQLCINKKILPRDKNHEIVKTIDFVNNKRNDVVHANIELKRPRSLLKFNAPEHEKVLLEEMPDEIRKCVSKRNGKRTYLSAEQEQGAYIVYEYKKAAKDTLDSTKKILQYLFKSA